MGIAREKIQLTVYSPNVLTLTVVDLPGLVKVNNLKTNCNTTISNAIRNSIALSLK